MAWLVLQLADSGFPTGGFAHSAGLEALVQAGEVEGPDSFARFVEEAAWQAGYGALPLSGAAHDDPSRFAELDALCDAFLIGRVANRTSRVLGRAFVSTCAEVFGKPSLRALREAIRARRAAGHHAPVFGAAMRALEVDRRGAQRLLLHAVVRGAVAAGVRLGVVGPLDGQRLLFELAPRLEGVLACCADLSPEALAQTSPVIEAYASHHDGLYSRLFQS